MAATRLTQAQVREIEKLVKRKVIVALPVEYRFVVRKDAIIPAPVIRFKVAGMNRWLELFEGRIQ